MEVAEKYKKFCADVPPKKLYTLPYVENGTGMFIPLAMLTPEYNGVCATCFHKPVSETAEEKEVKFYLGKSFDGYKGLVPVINPTEVIGKIVVGIAQGHSVKTEIPLWVYENVTGPVEFPFILWSDRHNYMSIYVSIVYHTHNRHPNPILGVDCVTIRNVELNTLKTEQKRLFGACFGS